MVYALLYREQGFRMLEIVLKYWNFKDIWRAFQDSCIISCVLLESANTCI
jgi:hypothetical protein